MMEQAPSAPAGRHRSAWNAALAAALFAFFGAPSAPAGILPDRDPPGERLALASPKKKDKEKKAAGIPSAEDLRKRGAELENYVYEIFDPNAKDPLAELGIPMAGLKGGAGKWWIFGSGVVLAGAGVAGYFLFLAEPQVKPKYVVYSDTGI